MSFRDDTDRGGGPGDVPALPAGFAQGSPARAGARPRPPAPPPLPPSTPTDRRAALRYGSVIGRAWLGWKSVPKFETRAAFVIDVSAGGALVACEGPPPAEGPVFIQVAGALLPRWFEARVVQVRRGNANVCAVRLAFPEGCPYDLFMGLAYGRFLGRPEG